MSNQYLGGFITKSPPAVSTSAASGIWTLDQQAQLKQQGLWPSQPPPADITWGTPVVFYSGTTSETMGVSLQSSGKVAIVYQDESSGGPNDLTRCIIGTISGNSISFGTPVSANSHGLSSDARDISYDSYNNKLILGYREPVNGYGAVKVGTPSGTTTSWGTETIFESSTTRYITFAYNPVSYRFLTSYQAASFTADGYSTVTTISGTTASFGAGVQFSSGSVTNVASCFDTVNNKVGIMYNDVATANCEIISGTMSGTNVSFGSSIVYRNSTTPQIQFGNQLAFNSVQGRAVAQQWVISPSEVIFSASVSFASSTPSFGTLVETSFTFYPPTLTTVAGSNFVTAGYSSSAPTNYVTRKGLISGTNVSLANKETIGTSTGTGQIFYDPVSNKVIYVYKGGSNYGTAIIGTVS